MPVVRLSMGGDRCASQGHAWGSPKAGGCQWRPSGRSFDASALTTTRVAARHLVRGATRPLRRGRARWMPTALGSVIWEFTREASSLPGQGVKTDEEGSAPRNEGLERIKTRSGGFGGKQRLASIDIRARPEKQPRGVKGLRSHSTVNTKYHSSAPTPRQRRSPTHRREAATIDQR